MTPRVVLAGSNLAATYALDVLLDALAPESLLVIAPHGAGHPDWHASLADHADVRGVEAIAPPDVNAPGVLSAVEAHRPDLLLSVYYTQVFRDLLEVAPTRTMLNFHPSRLPNHRGVAPLIWAIAEGDTMTGLTVHHIDANIDTGRIVLQWPLPIHRNDTGHSLHLKMAKLVRSATADLLRAYLDHGRVPDGMEQVGEATYHGRSDPALNHVDWAWPREGVRNVIRALAPPLPGAYANIDGERLVLVRVETVDRPDRTSRRAPGMVELVRGEPPLVWAIDGPVALLEYFDGSESRSAEELVTSGRLREGQILA